MSQEVSMLRVLLVTVSVLVLTLPVMAQDAEVGEVYEITIETEEDNQYTGPYGQVKMGDVVINVPNAKEGETYRVTITEIRVNQYSGNRQASCDFEQIGGEREGTCLGAP